MGDGEWTGKLMITESKLSTKGRMPTIPFLSEATWLVSRLE